MFSGLFVESMLAHCPALILWTTTLHYFIGLRYNKSDNTRIAKKADFWMDWKVSNISLIVRKNIPKHQKGAAAADSTCYGPNQWAKTLLWSNSLVISDPPCFGLPNRTKDISWENIVWMLLLSLNTFKYLLDCPRIKREAADSVCYLVSKLFCELIFFANFWLILF